MQKGSYVGGCPSVWLKGEEGVQEMLVAANPEAYLVPPYVGHKGWMASTRIRRGSDGRRSQT